MKQQELREELELLQRRINELSQQEDNSPGSQQKASTFSADDEKTDSIELNSDGKSEENSVLAQLKQAVESENLIPDDIKQQLEALVEQIDDEVRELPPLACLTIFTAGLLLGRYMR